MKGVSRAREESMNSTAVWCSVIEVAGSCCWCARGRVWDGRARVREPWYRGGRDVDSVCCVAARSGSRSAGVASRARDHCRTCRNLYRAYCSVREPHDASGRCATDVLAKGRAWVEAAWVRAPRCCWCCCCCLCGCWCCSRRCCWRSSTRAAAVPALLPVALRSSSSAASAAAAAAVALWLAAAAAEAGAGDSSCRKVSTNAMSAVMPAIEASFLTALASRPTVLAADNSDAEAREGVVTVPGAWPTPFLDPNRSLEGAHAGGVTASGSGSPADGPHALGRTQKIVLLLLAGKGLRMDARNPGMQVSKGVARARRSGGEIARACIWAYTRDLDPAL